MPLSRAHLRLALSAVCVAAALLSACGDEQPARKPNIVLVLVDQLRKDAADLWMKDVRALADDGVVFDAMRAVAPWTYPSVISMFSGLYPQQHGADGAPRDGRILTTFDEHLPLLPRLLRNAGFHTAGFVTNPFLQTWNAFHEGFDHYAVDEFIGNQGNMRGLPQLVWTERMFANTVNPTIEAFYDGRPYEEPEFTYVHYIDVHGPWDDAPFAPEYATSVRYIDEKILDLYELFHARYDGDLIFLVTSDHGQELDDDLEVGEGAPWRSRKRSLHDFNLHIPFLVLPGTPVPAGVVVDEPCANIDVFPTLLDWVGLSPPSNIPGRSLLPAVRGGPVAPAGRILYAKMSAFNRLDDCILYGNRKFIRYFNPETREESHRRSFNVAEDPREMVNLGADFGSAAALLDEAATTNGIEYQSRFEEVSQEVIEGLRELGYVGEDE